jgi:hypothetical protein
MTREEAESRAAQLNGEHPDRATHRWHAREGADGWEVARIALPAAVRIDPLEGAVEGRPRPEAARPAAGVLPGRRRAVRRGLEWSGAQLRH